MNDIRKIRIMISSRAQSKVLGDVPLTEVRLGLQRMLHSLRWASYAEEPPMLMGRDQAIFDVWIHETDPGEPGHLNTLEVSLREINLADMVLVLYTGEAGSAAHDSELGICHAEFEQAMARRPEIVAMIDLTPIDVANAVKDRNFQVDVARRKMFMKKPKTQDELHQNVIEAIHGMMASLVVRGARAGSNKLDRGPALNWNLLDLKDRQKTMRSALLNTVQGDCEAVVGEDVPLCCVAFGQHKVVVRIDAIPASLSIAAARERVGQPFQQDHQRRTALETLDAPGIIHLIACHRGATEAQALRMLGSNDAIAIASDFGVYAADHFLHVQIVLLSKCSDATATALAYRRFCEWLDQSGELQNVIKRAQQRRALLPFLGPQAPGSE